MNPLDTDPERSAAILAAILRATSDGILVVNEDGGIVAYNRRFVEMWDLPEAVVLAQDNSRALAFVLDALKDPGGFVTRTMELYAEPARENIDRLEFKDGRVYERYSPALPRDVPPFGRVWSFRDVTPRSVRDSVSEDPERSLSLLRATLESTADGLLVVDTEGKIVRFNRKFIEMWRIPDAIVASADDNEALHFVVDQLKDPDRFLKKVRELYDHPESQSYDWLEFKDGRIFERYSQPQSVAGRVVGRVWSFRDVTDRVKMEEILRRQARTFDHIFDGVVVTDLSGRIVDWNAGAANLFGYTKEAALSKPLSLLHAAEEGPDSPRSVLSEMRKTGRWAGQMRFRRQDGVEGICETAVVPHTDEYGRMVAAIFVHRDITGQEKPGERPREKR